MFNVEKNLAEIISMSETAWPEVISADSTKKIPPFVIYVPFITNWAGNLPKFHFMFCNALQSMPEDRLLERCRISCRTDGHFLMSDEKMHKLEVCKVCLDDFVVFRKTSLYKIKQIYGYGENFNIARLFRDIENWGGRLIDNSYFKKLKMGIILDNKNYPPHWEQIIYVLKELKHWKCEQCGADLSDKHGLLQVHHKNGVKSDISPENLIVLCKLCHSQQPSHSHMKVKEWEEKYILNHRP